MMPYSKINVGDVFESSVKWTGSELTWEVIDKAEGLIEIKSSYQHPALAETLWKRPTNKIFTKRIYEAGAYV